MKEIVRKYLLLAIVLLLQLQMRPFLSAEEAILVRLATEVQRLPVYLTHFVCNDAGFDDAYCARLERSCSLISITMA